MTAVALQLILFMESTHLSYLVSTHLIFYACLELRFPDVKTNPATGVLFLVSAKFSAVIFRAFPGI